MAAAELTHPQSRTLPAGKIDAPHAGALLLRRQRLTDQLERLIGDPKTTTDVCLVAAPAGYGKTTLLAQWAESTALPTVWYHADASDADPASLTYGLIRALRTRLPRGHWRVKDLLGRLHHGAPSPLDVRRAAEVFIADLRAHIARPLTLILTGVDAAATSAGTRDLLEHLLVRTPDHLRVVIECREIPPLSLSPLLPQRRLDGLGLEDLQFTREELGDLLRLLEMEAGDDELDHLQWLCDGWVTGALLATGALWPRWLAPRAGEELNREAVFGYLAAEVLDRLPSHLLDFAVRAAVLSYMTAPLCRDLLGVSDARARLAALERSTGFLSHVGRRPQEPVYRFQPVLREALLDHLARRHSSDELRALHGRAARLLEAHGDDEEAVRHFVASGDSEGLSDLVETRRGALLRAGKGRTLARWIELLPPDARARSPQLAVLLAELHRVSGRTADAQAAIEGICTALLPRAAEAPQLAARALLVRADVRHILGRYADAQRDCEESLALLPDEADDLIIQARLIIAVCLKVTAGPRAALATLEGMEARCRRLGDLWALGRLHYVRSNLALAQGAYAQAEASAAAGLLCAQEANDEVRAIACLLNLGAVRQHLGQLDAARRDLEAALEQAQAVGHVQAEAYALGNLADLELTAGNHDVAVQLALRAAGLDERIDDRQLRVSVAAIGARALALSGAPGEALERLAPVERELAGVSCGIEWTRLQIALGFVHYHLGALAGAERALDRAISHSHDHDLPGERARALLVLGAVRLGQGDPSGARALLEDALGLAHQIDGTPAPLLEARHLPALWPMIRQLEDPLAAALLARIAPDASQRAPASPQDQALDQADGGPAGARSYLRPVVPPGNVPFRIFALGETRVLIGPDRVSRWTRPRSRELLLFLLDRGGSARGDAIVEEIWGDRSPEVAEAEFRKTRHALKLALGRPCLEQQGGRWTLTVECWLDVREFERLVAEGRALVERGEAGDAAVALRQALALWGGPYLDDVAGDWAFARREALHRTYLDALELFAAIELQLGRHDAAAQLCYQILDAEPFRETAHRGLMAYFAARGEFAKAIAQYARCVAVLRDEVGVAPSPQTQSLRTSIQAKMRNERAAAALPS